MRGVLVLFGAVLFVVCLPFYFDGLHDCRVDAYTQNFAEISTSAGETSANVTLSQTLYNTDDIASISVSSNRTSDSPFADSINPVSNVLTIGGLVSEQGRTLSIDYEIASASLAEAPSASALLIILAIFAILGVLGLIAGAIYTFFSKQ